MEIPVYITGLYVHILYFSIKKKNIFTYMYEYEVKIPSDVNVILKFIKIQTKK